MRRSRSGGRTRCRRGAPSEPAAPTSWARSTPARSRACATKRGPIRATPTSCTTRCSRAGFLTDARSRARSALARLARRAGAAGRATLRLDAPGSEPIWIAAERLPELQRACIPALALRAADRRAAGARRARRGRATTALVELLRGRARDRSGRSTAAALGRAARRRRRRGRRGAARARSGGRRPARLVHARRAGPATSNGATAGCSRASIATR